ncbi:MAG: sigma-54-dependent Fis family transcriptional regulator [Planctomycetes bacterium]|nr:sigma-54-dependent Fis family transcriptional regulator [Planctomycetota bacterium]
MSDENNTKPKLLYGLGPIIREQLPPNGGLDGFRVVLCNSREDLRQKMAEAVPDVLLTDTSAIAQGQNILSDMNRRFLRLPVVVLTENPEVETVVQCVRNGAYDVIDSPNIHERLESTLRQAADEHRMLMQIDQLEEAYKRWGKFGGKLVGVSPALQRIYSTIAKVAKTDATVLLFGESGTGKELVAHTIHRLSARTETGNIISVNCATIPKDLLESQLFGHEKGAFTGADRRRIGRCEQAHLGTLFLDEICEMDVDLQSKLLRFLEERQFTRVGGSEPIHVDTRLLAATNRDPIHEVEQGSLREDLYYRLNVVPIHLPPLRERPEDIPVLAKHFLETFAEKHNKYFWDFSADAMRLFLKYPWPGNVRELRNTIERIVVLATTDTVTANLIPEPIHDGAENQQMPDLSVEEALETVKEALSPPPVETDTSGEIIPLEELEKRAIVQALEQCGENVSEAARQLGLSRATMYRKLAKYGLK